MEQKHKEELKRLEKIHRKRWLPSSASAWDRFWFTVIHFMGTLQWFIIAYVVQEPCWRSQDGVVRQLRELGDRHLKNVEWMLYRNDEHETLQYFQVCNEMADRGLKRRYRRRDGRSRIQSQG